MKTFLNILLLLGVFAIFIVIGKNWDKIVAWWNKPKGGDPLSCQQQYDAAQAEFSKSGQSCILTAVDVVCPTDSTFVVSTNPCIEKKLKDNGWKSPDQNNSNNSSSVDDLQVSNPEGAFMYYQSPTASGGMNYGKSNFSLPYGTKLKLVKVWQTNVSTQPFSGYYETNFKQQFGANSGFFDTKDIIKL